jgi:mannose-1-phosphate guanylyltransferase
MIAPAPTALGARQPLAAQPMQLAQHGKHAHGDQKQGDDLENHDVLVVHADNLSVFSFESFAQSYYDRQSRQLMSMMLFEADNPSQCGIVELDSDSNVIAMHEKVSNPPGNLANGAVYIFSTQIIDWISQNNVSDISTEVIPEFLGKILAWKNSEYHRDIGTPESYGTAQKDFS